MFRDSNYTLRAPFGPVDGVIDAPMWTVDYGFPDDLSASIGALTGSATGILLGRNTSGLDTLKWMEPRAIAELVRNEHPQIIAIVMAHLDGDQRHRRLQRAQRLDPDGRRSLSARRGPVGHCHGAR